MAIDIDRLLENVQKVQIEGIIDVTKDTAGEDKPVILVLDFLTPKGAFRNVKDKKIRMIIGVDSPRECPNNLRFLALNLEQCNPKSLDLTIFMDANGKTRFGGHKWDPETGRVGFTYTLLTLRTRPTSQMLKYFGKYSRRCIVLCSFTNANFSNCESAKTIC